MTTENTRRTFTIHTEGHTKITAWVEATGRMGFTISTDRFDCIGNPQAQGRRIGLANAEAAFNSSSDYQSIEDAIVAYRGNARDTAVEYGAHMLTTMNAFDADVQRRLDLAAQESLAE